MRHIIPISGKDSLATALVQTTRYPDLPYEFLFNDVKAELPETYEWLCLVEQKTGWIIKRVGKSLVEIIRGYGGFLPGANSRYCTRESKIEPMEAMIGEDDCTVYYGLRSDEVRTGYVPIGKRNIIPVYPLREANIDLQGVYAILDAQNLTPPNFLWPRLFEAVLKRVGQAQIDRLTRIERTILFAGRSRANCFFCFFQRRYEFLWLYETHPDLFEIARGLEKEDYSLSKGFPLTRLDDPDVRWRLFKERVKAVCEVIEARLQGNLFGEPTDNLIALTSCGLICGK